MNLTLKMLKRSFKLICAMQKNTIVQSWEQMTPDEQGSISTQNNFFCGLHVVVGMADNSLISFIAMGISTL